MKKILIVTALAGFVRSFLTKDIELLQKMGYEVHCACNKNHPGSEGIEVFFTEHNVKFYQVNFSSNKPFSMQTIQAYFQLRKIIKNDEFILVHTHTPIAGAITRLICISKRKKGMKVIYTTHGFYFHKKSSKISWLVFGTIEMIMSNFCDAIVTINKEDYRNATRMHCENVFYINGMGIDIKKFKNTIIDRDSYRKKIGINKDDIMILGIGELSKRKNQEVVVKAIAQLKNSKMVFVHCGNAMNKKATKQEIIKIADENKVRIKLLGLRKDIPEICKCADIGTISSTREGLGLAGLEMIASGLPIVASNLHGIVDYVKDGINGYLANSYDEKEFSIAIKNVLSNNCNINKNELYKTISEFDLKKTYKQKKNIYEKILEEK